MRIDQPVSRRSPEKAEAIVRGRVPEDGRVMSWDGTVRQSVKSRVRLEAEREQMGRVDRQADSGRDEAEQERGELDSLDGALACQMEGCADEGSDRRKDGYDGRVARIRQAVGNAHEAVADHPAEEPEGQDRTFSAHDPVKSPASKTRPPAVARCSSERLWTTGHEHDYMPCRGRARSGGGATQGGRL